MSSIQSPVMSPSVAEETLAQSAIASSPGKATLADVARAAGVSTTTVSYVLNGKGRIPDATQQAVLEATKQLGYEANYYAQRIKGGCTNTIACFTETITGVAGEKVTLIQQEFIRRGFGAPLYGLGNVSSADSVQTIKELRRQRPRAIVFAGEPKDESLDELRRFGDEGGIVVCYDKTFPVDFEQIILDRELGAYDATRYLIEKGHRDIGISTHSYKPDENAWTNGFQRALRDCGLTYRAEWNCPFHSFEIAGKALAAHFEKMTEKPTAFYIVDDRVATAFVNYTLRSGLQIPHDVSVITHDQANVAEHCIVPLTVINHPTSQMVDSVVAMVFSRIEGQYNGPPRQAVISGQLIERESVRLLHV